MKIKNALLAITVATALTACSKGPESTVEAFHEAVSKGALSEAKEYLNPAVAQTLGPQKLDAILAAQAEQVQKCGGVASLKTEITGEGEIRNGTVTIDFKGDCPTKTDNIKLQKIDGKWMIGGGK